MSNHKEKGHCPALSERASNLIGGWSGIAAMLLTNVGFFVVAGGSPSLNAADGEIHAYVHGSATRLYTGGLIELAALTIFLVFAGRLWAVLRAAEGEQGWLATTGLVALSGSLAIGVGVAFASEGVSYYAGNHGAGIDVVRALLDLSALGFLVSEPFEAVFLATTAVIALRTACLPRWLGWSAAVIAVALPATLPWPNDLVYLPHILAEAWVIAVGIVLIRTPQPTLGRAEVLPQRA